MAECRERRRAATGPLKTASKAQKAFLRHRHVDTRVLASVTAYDAHYLISRLEREEVEYQNWRAQKQARGEWRAQ